jgi:hypothetical protein
MSTANFFRITLADSANTHIRTTISTIRPGQTINVLITTGTSSTITFPTWFKQPGDTPYIPSTSSGAKDILTLVSFDTSNLYIAAVKNLV